MFLLCTDDTFLMQMVDEPTRRETLMDLILTNKECLVEVVKFESSIGCSNHEMVEFRILRAGRRVKGKPAVLASPRMCMKESCGIMTQREGELLRAG